MCRPLNAFISGFSGPRAVSVIGKTGHPDVAFLWASVFSPVKWGDTCCGLAEKEQWAQQAHVSAGCGVTDWGPEGLESHSPNLNRRSVLMCWGSWANGLTSAGLGFLIHEVGC